MKRMIYSMQLFTISLLLLFTSSTLLQAQPHGGGGGGEFYIKGTVVEDGTETLLEYVNVVVYSKRDSSLVTGTITDSKGHFKIKLNRPGKFYVTADFIGFDKVVIDDVALGKEKSTFNIGTIVLKPAAMGIDAVEVVAEKPFVSYKLDRKVVEVSRNPSAQGGTAVDALENVPSIDIDIEGNVSVRGSGDFTVLIDGRQSPLTGSDALNQIPSSAIDQIEIITNPSVKYDPDGTAGIINIITKKGKLKGHSLVANASVGSSPQASADVTYSYRNEKLTFTGSGGFRDTEMEYQHLNERETVNTDTISGDEYLSYIYTDRDGLMNRGNAYIKGSLDYHLSESNTLTIGGNFSNYKFGRSFLSQTQSLSINTNKYELSNTQFKVTPQTWQINIGDKHVFNDDNDHYLTTDFLYQWRKSESTDQIQLNSSDSLWNEGELLQPIERAITTEDANRIRLEINYSLPINENMLFESGYTYRNDEYEQQYTREIDPADNGNWIPNSEFDDVANFDRNIHAAWAVLKGKLLGIQYSGGLRLEYTDRNIKTEKDNWNYNYNKAKLYPSLSLAKEWENGHILQASYSERINRPRDYHLNPFSGLSDGYSQFKPNPELQPEYAYSGELNYQKNWGQSFIAVETFYRYTDNKMDRILEVNGDTLVRTMVNLGYESDAGGELAFNIKFFKWWTFNPSATVSYNESEGLYDNELRNASSMNYRGSLVNNFFLPSKTRIQLMSYYRGARTEIDGTREPTYWASAAVRQDFFDRKLSATLRIDDIFSTRKREGYTYTENTTVYSKGQRKSPTFVLSLSYKINPTTDKKRNGSNGNGGEGMDMDF